MPNVVEVVDLVKRYRGATSNAVDGVSLSVAEGSFFAMLGPNGAGKTTTLSILTTTLAPTSGSVRVAGHDIERDASAVRREVGIIFQSPSLDLNLTAEENVRLHVVLYGLFPFRPSYRMMPEAYKARISELAAVLSIENDIFRPLRTFSGGMRRKLEIVRSLMHRPRVLFLDEPTSGLDAAARRDLWDYLRAMRLAERTSVFLTTHYLAEAEDADAVVILNRGRVVARGTPREIKKSLADEYLEIDSANRVALRGELDALAIDYDGRGPVRLHLAPEATHQTLRAITTPLTVVRTVSPTLEDAYLRLVASGGDDGTLEANEPEALHV